MCSFPQYGQLGLHLSLCTAKGFKSAMKFLDLCVCVCVSEEAPKRRCYSIVCLCAAKCVKSARKFLALCVCVCVSEEVPKRCCYSIVCVCVCVCQALGSAA